MVGDEDYPILYSVFANNELTEPTLNTPTAIGWKLVDQQGNVVDTLTANVSQQQAIAAAADYARFGKIVKAVKV